MHDIGHPLHRLHAGCFQQDPIAFGPVDPRAQHLREHEADAQHADQTAEQRSRPQAQRHACPLTGTAST